MGDLYSFSDVMDALVRVAFKLNHVPSFIEYEAHRNKYDPSGRTVLKEFQGSWPDVRKTIVTYVGSIDKFGPGYRNQNGNGGRHATRPSGDPKGVQPR